MRHILRTGKVLKKSPGLKSLSYYSAENVFSEENINRTIAKFSNLKCIRFRTHQPAKRAAVLVTICEVEDKVSLLYTLKAGYLKSNKGQVSFPGGMQAVSDRNLEDTAVRETKQALGIDPSSIEVWGSGNTIITKGETSVMPVLGRIMPKLKFKNNIVNMKNAGLFTVPLEDLCNPSSLGYTQFRNTYSVPVFLGGKHRIWGLTALITNMFLSSLLPQQAYHHRIKYLQPLRISKISPN